MTNTTSRNISKEISIFTLLTVSFFYLFIGNVTGVSAQSTKNINKPDCQLKDGVYELKGSTYRVDVTQSKDTLTFKEANKTSIYQHVGNCEYSYTNPNNGITYLARPDKGSVVLYKPGQAANEHTRLVLLSQKPTASKCTGIPLTVENPDSLHPGEVALYGLTRQETAKYVGTYKANDRNAPRTILNADGTGVFEVYGAPAPAFVYQIESWYIQANCDGTAITTDYEAAKAYFIILKLERPYQNSIWLRHSFAVTKSNQSAFHLDRAKQP
ncbi:hypothetical protein [Limnobacter parvus]|uniref:Uncharacterized protein n=1 Tax=Limnobacter parvus TaxID=2939690 RepID=A0ABT1XJ93_9BURK|nr:hypothetical protein [Limnobacter parvus]MCR2747353.1 hypothetical protein [Limnobacter parvus]